jgi:predicted nucleotidyltransferase
MLNLTLEVFLRVIDDKLGVNLISVILYGSVLYDDLSPGYGDLDFLEIISEDLSDGT